jgi:hypothetical protein
VSARAAVTTYTRDAILFVLGVVIILKQAGVLFPSPSGGPSLELLGIGALFCNGPLFLQYLTLRRGISGSSEPAESSASVSPSVPPSDPS